MCNHYTDTKKGTVFTLYFKEKDVAVNLFRHELVNLIKEAAELLEVADKQNNFLFKTNVRKQIEL